MTMRVTILSTVMGESGSLLTAGSTYTVGDQFGQELVRSGRATDTDRAMAVPQTELKPYFATDPLTGAVTGLVGPGGGVIRIDSPQTVTVIGDSQIQNTYLSGYSIAPSPSINGFANVLISRNAPTGAGSLNYDHAAKTARWAAFGESYGASVDVTNGGVFVLASSGGSTCTIFCTARSYTASGTSTVTVTGNIYHKWMTGSIVGALDALTGHRLTFTTPYLGIGGNYISDVTARYAQATKQGGGIIIDVSGTNSIVAQGLTADQALADAIANYNLARASGAILITSAILPRFGTDGADNTNYSAAFTKAISRYNSLLYAAAKSRNGWYIVDADAAADPANNGRARVGYTSDGLHIAAAMAYIVCQKISAIINAIYPPTKSAPTLISAGQLYDATANPGGNLINSGAGSFISTGGTAGTGVTAVAARINSTAYAAEDCYISGGNLYRVVVAGTTGTVAPLHTSGVATDGTVQAQFIASGASVGLAASWTFQRSVGTVAVAKAFKISDQDGDWQAFFITSSLGIETIYGYTDATTPANFVTGDVIDAGCTVDVQGVGCNGVAVDLSPDGAMTTASSITAAQLDGTLQGFTGRATVAIPQGLSWISTSVTSVRYRAYFRAQANAAYLVKVRDAYIRKVT